MKGLLTSSGLDNTIIQKRFVNLIEKPINEISVLLIFGANAEEMIYVKENKSELISLGIQEKNITDINLNTENSYPENNFDVIYFCGGNTYYLLDKIIKLKLNIQIKKLVREGSIYIGVSAGSIIAGQSIEIAGWGSEGDKNKVGLKDLLGLHLTDIAIFPHYENNLEEELKKFREKVNYPVEELRNGEALLIINKEVEKLK